MFANTPKILILIFLLTICFVLNLSAQTAQQNDLGTEVKILGGIGSKQINCFPTNNLVVSKQEFEKLLNDERCTLLKILEVDFSKHTLINYRVGGDCHMSVTHKIFRNSRTKTYAVEVKNYWGRCRAGGSYHSWIVIDKIPEDYKVELKETQLDDIRKKDKTSFDSALQTNLPKPPAIYYSKTVDLEGCIPMYRQNSYVIKDKETYLNTNLRK